MKVKEKINIHQDQCIGCGLCVVDCPNRVIELQDKKAVVISDECMKCGHCIGVCPKNAVEIQGLDMREVKSYDEMSYEIQPENLMDFYKSIRTIRQFKEEEIDEKVIASILEAGRYTATGTNRQGVRYIVVQKEINLLEDMVLPKLRFLQRVTKPIGKFIKLKYNLQRYIFDRGFLFKNAKLLILVVSEDELDGGLAAKSMELMSRTYGLGGLHVGIFTTFANKSRAIKSHLRIAKKEQVVACLALGYPDVKYQRTVPRRKALVTWR